MANPENQTAAPRHPAEAILGDVERIVEERMGARWRGYRDVADALAVLLHEMDELTWDLSGR